MIDRVIKSYWKNGLFDELVSKLEIEEYDEVHLGCSELLFRMSGDSEGVDSLSETPVLLILIVDVLGDNRSCFGVDIAMEKL